MSNLKERLDLLREEIQKDDFLDGKGLSNEVNIRIFCYVRRGRNANAGSVVISVAVFCFCNSCGFLSKSSGRDSAENICCGKSSGACGSAFQEITTGNEFAHRFISFNYR